jgi:hypothetical protein
VKVEAEGMMNAHIKDAVALCDWAARMEYEIQANWLFLFFFRGFLTLFKIQKNNNIRIIHRSPCSIYKKKLYAGFFNYSVHILFIKYISERQA